MIHMDSPRRSRLQSHRRGAVLIVLLAVFAVTIGLAGVWTRRIVSEHRRLHRVGQQVQARWIAEAGVRRAVARLAADPQFDGEEWGIAADELGQNYSAAVILRVEPSDGAPGNFRITAEARCPKQDPRVRITKTVTYSPPISEPVP